MPTLLIHEKVVFEDQMVPATGHIYMDCTFHRCTMIVTQMGDYMFTGCGFEGCVWQLNMSVYDHRAWAAFLENLAPVISKSLPREKERDG